MATPIDFSDIWQDLEAEIRATGVQCWRSGACCNFHEFDHDVFATSEELLALVAHKKPDHQGVEEGLCPYWQDRSCRAHSARPLSCRVYHCNQDYEAKHQTLLYERYLAKIQARIKEAGREYDYQPMLPWLRAESVAKTETN